MAMTRPDVVVVGAGVIGAICAYELAKAGLRVTVVERAEPASEASGASAGLLSSGPVPDLGRLSRDLYPPLAEALRAEAGIDIEHEPSGHLVLCMSEDEARWGRKLADEDRNGADGVEFMEAGDLRRLEPEVTGEVRGALLMPRNGWVHTGQLVAALVRAASRRGVRFVLGQPVEEVLQTGGRITGVRARGVGTVEAGAVLLAAGAWTGAIDGVPPALAVRPVKGQMLALDHSPPLIRHAVIRGEVYLVPRASGECLVGATVEEGVADRSVTPAGLHWLLTEALVTVPAFARVPFRHAWAGLRPAARDGLPIIGPWPGLPGLFVATGHYRNGILLAPVTGQIVREWIVDGRCSLPAEAFLPDRLVR